jgi:MFS family permease
MVFLHAAAWIPIISIPFIFRPGASQGAPWALLFAAALFVSVGAFSVPAWQSLMSDYIPTKKRGRYFGWRNRLQGILTVAVTILAGLILHFFGKGRLDGFLIIFIFAMACRFAAWVCLLQMREPFRHTSHDVYFSFFDFIRQYRTSNFAKFVFFASLLNFSAFLSGPLLPVFLLTDLGFDYATFMFLISTAALSGFLTQGIWGMWGDLDGNLKVLKVAGWGIAVTPLFWMISRHPGYLFFVQLFAGAMWGGWNLLILNFMMEAVTPQKRIRCISYYNVVNSIFIFIAAGIGGYLFHRLPAFQGYSFLTLFLLSCFSRLSVMTFLSRRVQEVRAVPQ